MYQNNLRCVPWSTLLTDAHSNPYYFKAYGRQFIRRFNVVEIRRLWTEGEVYNVSRVMQTNPHGLEANLKITDNRTIKSDSISNRNSNEIIQVKWQLILKNY